MGLQNPSLVSGCPCPHPRFQSFSIGLCLVSACRWRRSACATSQRTNGPRRSLQSLGLKRAFMGRRVQVRHSSRVRVRHHWPEVRHALERGEAEAPLLFFRDLEEVAKCSALAGLFRPRASPSLAVMVMVDSWRLTWEKLLSYS